MQKAKHWLGNLDNEEDGDDDDEHQGGRVRVSLPSILTLPRTAAKDGKSLAVQPSFASNLLLCLVDRQPASPLLCSPHGGEEEDVEDDQGDAGQELDKEAAEPPEGDEVGPSDPGDPVGEVDQANLPLPIIQEGCRVGAIKQPDLWFCCLVNTESTFTTSFLFSHRGSM